MTAMQHQNAPSAPNVTEVALTESPSLRAAYASRVDALDKVGALSLLPDGIHASTELVADYFEVPIKTIESLAQDNREELETYGYRTIDGEELTRFKRVSGIRSRARSLALFTRPAVLNIGQMLTKSDVAKKVREYLITVEATATPEHRAEAIGILRLRERSDYKNILESLKAGGAESGEDYLKVQNGLYMMLFGKTARQIMTSQPQRTGIPYKRGGGFRPSKYAKDYMTEKQLKLLDNAVLVCVAQADALYGNAPSVDQMLQVAIISAGIVTRSIAA